jgi:hypothetical protein
MTTNSEPKRLKCEYVKPENVSERTTYYLTFLKGMVEDPLFTAIATLLGDAKTQVLKLQTAEIDAQTRIPGKVAIRDKENTATEIMMDKVLGKVQEAGDDDLENAEIIFKAHNLKIVAYKKRERDIFAVKHGKTSKTFAYKNKKAHKAASYLCMISPDKNTWFVGNFGRSTTGIVDKCGEEDLVVGKLYFLKSQFDIKGVKSDWSQIIEKYCI